MPTSNNSSRYKRANLFLLRVWCDDSDIHEQSNKGETSDRTWHGIVQRTITGEAQSFEAKDNLVEVLEAMLFRDQPKQSKPQRKQATGDDFPPNDNQSESNKATEENQ